VHAVWVPRPLIWRRVHRGRRPTASISDSGLSLETRMCIATHS